MPRQLKLPSFASMWMNEFRKRPRTIVTWVRLGVIGVFTGLYYACMSVFGMFSLVMLFVGSKTLYEAYRDQKPEGLIAGVIMLGFSFMFTGVYFQDVVIRRVFVSEEGDKITVRIRDPFRIYVFVFGMIWLVATIGITLLINEATPILLFSPIGPVLIWASLGATEIYECDHAMLRCRYTRHVRRTRREYDVVHIQNMRFELTGKKRNLLLLACDYGTEKHRVNEIPLCSEEARELAGALTRFIPIDTKALGAPGPWLDEHVEEMFSEQVRTGKAPHLPTAVKRELILRYHPKRNRRHRNP